jgi:hypothetical protein
MYDYFRFYLTNDFSRVPTTMRATPNADEMEREKEMVTFVDGYLTGSGGESKGPDDKEDKVEGRKMPWKKALDDKMFYL